MRINQVKKYTKTPMNQMSKLKGMITSCREKFLDDMDNNHVQKYCVIWSRYYHIFSSSAPSMRPRSASRSSGSLEPSIARPFEASHSPSSVAIYDENNLAPVLAYTHGIPTYEEFVPPPSITACGKIHKGLDASRTPCPGVISNGNPEYRKRKRDEGEEVDQWYHEIQLPREVQGKLKCINWH